MFRVARPALVRLTGRTAPELDAFFAELTPLHARLRSEIGHVRSAGALIQAPLLYVLVRALRPKRVVETGISSGYSARLMLEALERNGEGHLDSIGIDVFGMSRRPGDSLGELEDRHVGWLVPETLRHRWTLHLGRSEERLPALALAGSRNLDLFVHDSLHQYPTMRWEYSTALPAMPPGALLCSHDVHANRAWPEFVAERRLGPDEELDHDLGAVRVPA
jgi:hypothetical protein